MMKVSVIISSLLFILIFTSCKTSKNNIDSSHQYNDVYINSSREKIKHEKIIGFDLTNDDNIDLYREVERWLGAPYKYGGNTNAGIDCSGLVMNIYMNVFGIRLYRNSAQILENNCIRIKEYELQEGDLVFFSYNGNKKKVNHVGILLKNRKFAHASSSKGVIISSLDESYYKRTFVCFGRVQK